SVVSDLEGPLPKALSYQSCACAVGTSAGVDPIQDASRAKAQCPGAIHADHPLRIKESTF
ncbi:hypothetical protein, partial [Ochrobactrum sp. C6C9]|uniref:hypothetical protein n=1 Tax=Ochrobactrum sp. C6C9 TaxID=2736662 RepID=UPI00352FF1E3